jgi:uncharacterized membrane protein
MTEEELYRIELAELKKLNEKRTDARHSLVKYVISLASGSLVIITSFHKTNNSYCSLYLYMASLSLIAFGILALALSLYGDTEALHRAAKGNWEYLKARYFQKDLTAKPYSGDKHKFYKICETIGFVSLLLAVFSFVVLAKVAY